MKKNYSEISGTYKWTPVVPPSEVDPSEVIKSLGIYEEAKLAVATSAVVDISDFLRLTIPGVPHYSPPLGLVRRFLSKFFAPEMPIGLCWGFRENKDFNASAGGRNDSYGIFINYGAIVYAASLCCEIASIELEGAPKSTTASLKDLFSVIPTTAQGISRYQQLLRMTMLYLFGHEFAHVVGGHCGYWQDNKKMPDGDRRAIELDADLCGGHAVGAWITQNLDVATKLGWLPNTKLQGDDRLVELCVLASLTLFILFQKLTDAASNKYLPPETRSCVFIAGLGFYIEQSLELPFKPKVVIDPECFSQEGLMKARRNMISLLRRTSVESAISEVEPTEQAFAQLCATQSTRELLKERLHQYRPAGAQEYLKRAMTSTSSSEAKATGR